MAHIRSRHIVEALGKTLAASPIVGVLGHRQVGKTTLIESLASHYVSLDDPDQDARLRRSVSGFLRAVGQSGLTALDECQNHESLFRGLKEWVRTRKRPGQFLLSGSVRFTSKKSIRESLTGRILYHDLYPLLISELCDRPLPMLAKELLEGVSFRHLVRRFEEPKKDKPAQKAMDLYLNWGGLPGVCFLRSDLLRTQKFEDQLITILDRDLRLLYPTNLRLDQIRSVLVELAIRQGEDVTLTDLAKRTRLTIPTVRKLIIAFESLFLVRPLAIEGGRSGPAYYFEDMGERHHLVATRSALQVGKEAREGERWIHYLYVHLRGQWSYRLEPGLEYFKYHTRNGARVPLAIRSRGSVLGFIPMDGHEPSRVERAAARSFLGCYNQSKVLFLRNGLPEIIDDRMAIVDPIFLTI